MVAMLELGQRIPDTDSGADAQEEEDSDQCFPDSILLRVIYQLKQVDNAGNVIIPENSISYPLDQKDITDMEPVLQLATIFLGSSNASQTS